MRKEQNSVIYQCGRTWFISCRMCDPFTRFRCYVTSSLDDLVVSKLEIIQAADLTEWKKWLSYHIPLHCAVVMVGKIRI